MKRVGALERCGERGLTALLEQLQMNVVHITPSVSRLGGGLFASVRHLVRTLSLSRQARVTVLSVEDRYAPQDQACWAPVPVRVHRVLGPRLLGYAPGLAADLAALEPDLVNLHGLWKYASLVVWRWARRTGRPYVVSPHGMLEPWALQQGRRRKQVAMRLYQGPCLRGAACLRATSLLEARSIRLAGCGNPIAVIPNGVEVPGEPPRRPGVPGASRRRALFLSRIHPKKGLLNLVEAWRRVRPAGWELAVVGPDEGGHAGEVRAAIRSHGLQEEIRIEAAVWDGGKARQYFRSDLFILPSYSENFGLVIAEALSCGLPVITTQATPWEEVVAHRCGWWVGVGVEPLAEALGEACACLPETLREMGERGRRLILSKYTWSESGRKLAELCEWLLGRRGRPGCVLEE